MSEYSLKDVVNQKAREVQETEPQEQVEQEIPAEVVETPSHITIQQEQTEELDPATNGDTTESLAAIPKDSLSSLSNLMEETDKQLEMYESEYGKIEELEAQAVREEKEITVEKKSNFKDVIVEETEEEQTEVKESKEPLIDLNSIRIKKVNDSSKKYEEIKHKRRKSEVLNQVVLKHSAYTAKMAGFSSPELRNASRTIGSLDAYGRANYKFSKLYEKLRDTSAGRLTYDEFLKATSLMELNTLYFGAYCSTNPDTNKYPAECTFCKKKFEFDYSNRKLMIIKDDKREDVTEDVLGVIKSQNKAKELIANSDVNTITRKYLNESGDIVDLRHPSLYNQLEDTLSNVDEQMVEDNMEIVNTLPFIDKIYVLSDPDDRESEYIPLENLEDIIEELSMLDPEDDNALAEAINKIVEDADGIQYGFKGVVCPHCNKVQEEVIIPSMESLLFMTHQFRLSKK